MAKIIGKLIGHVLGYLTVTWAVCCLLVRLISLCFGLNVTLPMATGVWLCIMLIKIFFKLEIKVDKE